MNDNSESKRAKKPSIWYGVINPKWLAVKFLYIFEWGALGVVLPYQVIYYGALGLTTAQIGIIEALFIVIGMITTPLVTSIADKTGRPSIVLGLCFIAFAIPAIPVGFFSPLSQETHMVTLNFDNPTTLKLETCNRMTSNLLSNTTSILLFSSSESSQLDSENSTTPQIICPKFTTSNSSAILEIKPEANSNNCSVFRLQFLNDASPLQDIESNLINCTAKFPSEAADRTMIFLWICLLRCAAAISMAPFMALCDAINYDMLGPQYRGFWGQQRMLGTFAWGVAAILMGVAIDYFQNYKIAYITLGVLMVPAVLISFFWLPKPTVREKEENEKVLPFCQALRKIFASPIFCTNCAVAVASGMLFGIYMILWPQSLADLGATKTLLGLANVVICAVEIPSLFIAGALVNQMGEIPCFLLMFLAYGIRYGANAFLTPETVWLALPIEIVDFFSFGVYFPAATRCAANIAPPGTSSTVQGIIATSYMGIGSGSGVLLGSLIYNNYGRQIALLAYAAFAFICMTILLIFHLAYLRKAMAKLTKLAKNSAVDDNKDIIKLTDPLMTDQHL